MKEKILLDFTDCRYVDQIWEITKKQFNFPDYFGKNFSAFWDCLRDCFLDDVVICVKGLDTLPKNFEDYMQKFIKILNKLRADSPSVEIEIIS